jgi:RNA polymerase sigma factor (sigma-70 family)
MKPRAGGSATARAETPPAGGAPGADDVSSLRFERLLAELSVGFIGLTAAELDAAMRHALERIVSVLDTDLGVVMETVAEGQRIRITHAYAPALLEAVRRAVERDRCERDARHERERVHECFERLTPREREVFALVVTGLPNKLVADRLGTTEKTIKVHRGRVMAKMHAQSLAHLVQLAERIGIRVGPD